LRIKSFIKAHWYWGFIAAHIGKIIYLFHRVDWMSLQPITNGDHIQFFARVLRIHRFLDISGRTWGYDPFEMAGYPAVFREAGTYFLGLATYPFAGFFPTATLYNLLVLGGYTLVPFLIFFASRNFGGTKNQAWSAFGFCTLFFHHFEATRGLFGFEMAAFVGLLQVSLLWKWFQERDLKIFVWLCLASSLQFQLHPLVLQAVLIPNLFLVLAFFRKTKIRHHLLLMGGLVFVLGTNWYWIGPGVQFSNWYGKLPGGYVTQGWRLIRGHFFLLKWEFFDYVFSSINILLGYLSVMTILKGIKINKLRAVLFAVWLGALLSLTYFGDFFPGFRYFQPGRYKLFLFLLIFLISSNSFEESLWNRFKSKDFRILLSMLVMVHFSAGFLKESLTPFSTRLLGYQEEFIDYLEREGTSEGRILLECGYDQSPNIADIIPLRTGQALLGGHDPGNFLLNGFFIFGRQNRRIPGIKKIPVAFGRILSNTAEPEFFKQLETYNVVKVAAYTEETVVLLDAFSDILERETKVGKYAIFKVKRGPSWFETGSGKVSLDYDKLTIHEAAPGRIVLRFHWIQSLKSTPPLPLKPFHLEGAPAPFIEINNSKGLKDFVIYNL